MPQSAASDPFGAPDGLRTRGERLWDHMGGPSMQDAASRVLLEEACRCVDRLERLDEVLRGDVDAWLTLRLPRGESDDELVLHVDSALSEARQQQAGLARLLAAIAPVTAEGGKTGGDFLDELAAKREADGRPAAPRRART